MGNERRPADRDDVSALAPAAAISDAEGGRGRTVQRTLARTTHDRSGVLARGLVQRAVAVSGSPDSLPAGEVDRAVDRGTGGAAEALPHRDQIQASFGRHDVGAIQAHRGDGPAEGAAMLGASAFTTGNDVVFGGAPTLHTAAHEAAHVVQQRAGVHLAGGVGREGDVHEQHADAVADRVVRGESAEALLDQHAGGGGGGGGVQRVVTIQSAAGSRPLRLDEVDGLVLRAHVAPHRLAEAGHWLMDRVGEPNAHAPHTYASEDEIVRDLQQRFGAPAVAAPPPPVPSSSSSSAPPPPSASLTLADVPRPGGFAAYSRQNAAATTNLVYNRKLNVRKAAAKANNLAMPHRVSALDLRLNTLRFVNGRDDAEAFRRWTDRFLYAAKVKVAKAEARLAASTDAHEREHLTVIVTAYQRGMRELRAVRSSLLDARELFDFHLLSKDELRDRANEFIKVMNEFPANVPDLGPHVGSNTNAQEHGHSNIDQYGAPSPMTQQMWEMSPPHLPSGLAGNDDDDIHTTQGPHLPQAGLRPDLAALLPEHTLHSSNATPFPWPPVGPFSFFGPQTLPPPLPPPTATPVAGYGVPPIDAITGGPGVGGGGGAPAGADALVAALSDDDDSSSS